MQLIRFGEIFTYHETDPLKWLCGKELPITFEGQLAEVTARIQNAVAGSSSGYSIGILTSFITQ